jgi:hypothetical protein
LDRAYKVIHCYRTEGESFAVTFRFPGGLLVRGFLFNAMKRSLIWPRDLARKRVFVGVERFMYGKIDPDGNEQSGPDRQGLGIVTELLRRLVEKWLDEHQGQTQKIDNGKARMQVELDRLRDKYHENFREGRYRDNDELFQCDLKKIRELEAALKD